MQKKKRAHTLSWVHAHGFGANDKMNDEFYKDDDNFKCNGEWDEVNRVTGQ